MFSKTEDILERSHNTMDTWYHPNNIVPGTEWSWVAWPGPSWRRWRRWLHVRPWPSPGESPPHRTDRYGHHRPWSNYICMINDNGFINYVPINVNVKIERHYYPSSKTNEFFFWNCKIFYIYLSIFRFLCCEPGIYIQYKKESLQF